MTAEEWERANAAFLTEAIEWLRERLECYVAAMRSEAASRKRLPSVHLPVSSKMSPPPALFILGQRFGMTPFELDVLLLCIGFELDTRIGALCARAHDDPHRAHPTFALALTLFDDSAWDVTSLERPLRRWQFIEVEKRSALPLALSPLRSDTRTVDFIKGFNRLDERLSALADSLPQVEEETLPPSQRSLVDHVVSAFSRDRFDAAETVALVGPDTGAKLRIVAAAANRLGRDAWRVKSAWLPPGPNEVDDVARLWQREALLSPMLLVLDAEDVSDEREAEGARAARRFLARIATGVALMTPSAWAAKDEPPITLDVRAPTPGEQLDAWNRVLDCTPETSRLASQLTAQFSLDIATIERIANLVSAETSENTAERIWTECSALLRPRLDLLAQHIDVKAAWDDIVLPAEQEAQLRQIASQVRGRHIVYQEWGFAERMSRGLGISALFAGDSGTGKTMAAEVLASELRLPLYRIDLSAVVSKYIGETEKNLRALFDAADAGGFILFFDEADALFGKRSEVRDSHDRYANIEVNYLLQRIEAYRGLAILATNAKAALDAAFMRRLRFIVNFPHPGLPDRRRIWEKSFTAKVPVEDLELDRLAHFNATGGIIHNASLSAAFAAAADGGVVTTPLVLTSLKAEYRKLNRPINEADFRAR